MKIRILMLSLIGLIFFNSCSNDSSSSDRNSNNSTSQNLNSNTLLPKKVIINGRDNLQEEIYEFFYNQNKIDYIKSTITNDGGTGFYNVYFTYNGDLITQISFDDPNTTNDLNISYKYQNNQLIQIDEDGYKTVYTYNSNGTITSSTYPSTTFTLTNGLYNTTLTNGDSRFTYFINSYSPYKNITGIDKISIFPNNILFDLFLFPKNIKKDKLNSGEYSEYFYTYNDVLFPTSFFIQQFSPIYPTINIIKIIKNYTIIYN